MAIRGEDNPERLVSGARADEEQNFELKLRPKWLGEFIGQAKAKASVLSFVLEDIHPHDIGSILDHEGIVVRAGHHCAQPVMQRMQVPATTRASFSYFNTQEEIDALVSGILKVQEIFQ